MPTPPHKRVRLRLLDAGKPEKPDLIRQMEADSAAFEAQMNAEPGRSLLEDETGLSKAELDALYGEGHSAAAARAVGRRLRELDRPRNVSAYRKLFAAAKVAGLSDAAALSDDQILDLLGGT